jgi:transcriptional regulator with XRE-family HTH domain
MSILYKIRINKNKTQTEIAKILGCTQAEVSRLEKGKRRLRVETLQKLAKAFSMSVDELVAMQTSVDPQTIENYEPEGIPVIGISTMNNTVCFKDKTANYFLKNMKYQRNIFAFKNVNFDLEPRFLKDEHILLQSKVVYGKHDEIVIEFLNKNEHNFVIGNYKDSKNDYISVQAFNNQVIKIKQNFIIEVYKIIGSLKII